MSKPDLTILVVEDSDTGAKRCKTQLEQISTATYRILPASYAGGSLVLERSPSRDAVSFVDTIVVSLGKPHPNDFSFLKSLQNQLHSCLEADDVPLIVIGADSVDHAVQALKAGATDYLVGDRTTPDDLHRAIQRAIAATPHSIPHSIAPVETDSAEDSPSAWAKPSHHEQCEACFQQETAEIEAIYQSAPIGLAILDRDLRYTRINEQLAEINGFPVAFHLGRTIGEVLPELKETLEGLLHSVLTTGKPLLNSEVTGETPAQPGVKRHWLSHFVPVKNKDQVIGISIVCEEVTERVRAAEALRQNETRFRRMADNAPVMIWLSDNDGRYTYLSQSWCHFTGRSEESMLNLGWLESVHPDDQAEVTTVFLAMVKKNPFVRMEYRLRHHDGSYHWMLDTAAPWFNQDGNVEGYIGSVLDISDRKQTEEALKCSEERYRLLFESMNDGFFVIQVLFDDTNTPIDYLFLEVNPVFEKQTGLKDAVGKTARQVLPSVENHWFERYGNVALTGNSIRFEQISDAIDGWFDVSAFRIGPPEDRRVAILFKDISDRKRAEADRRQVELEREQLLVREQSAREAAERANRIKDEFLAVLSHELRSPLNPILGWTQLLQMRKLSEAETTEALETIERNVRLQTQLIDDLLDVAKILRGKLSLEVSSVNLVCVVEAAIETVQTAADSKAIDLYANLTQVGLVAGDAARLQQIVWNLLSNAVKFTPSGGRVDIKLRQVEQEAHIIVSDNGKGISAEFLPHIFEQFHQEDASTTRKYGGLGLGLNIVQQLTQAHGGTITVNSQGEGLGATFTVQIPLHLTEACPMLSQKNPLPTFDLTGIRVLAVDDEPDARELLRMLLTQHGAEVTAVESASRAIALLETFCPDVLVSDISMPDIDGYTLLQHIRSLPPERGGQTPAVALTAYARKEDYQRALDQGFQEHIAKPVELTQLIRAVLSVVPDRV
ncbi:MAG: PAS domain S-box protein [Elainellaceae cyanobacterium]